MGEHANKFIDRRGGVSNVMHSVGKSVRTFRPDQPVNQRLPQGFYRTLRIPEN